VARAWVSRLAGDSLAKYIQLSIVKVLRKWDVMDCESMRTALHDAVDRIFDDFLAADGATASTAQTPPTSESPILTRGDVVSDWSFTWPSDYGTETFPETRLWDVTTPDRSYRVHLARGTRASWGKTDRKRVIVFGRVGPDSYYPWAEFVETDTGQFAAPIPNPDHPRKILTPSDPMPGRYRSAHVEQAAALFDQIQNGPSLRLVVDSSDEEDMVRHGYWVARLRNRL